MDPLDFTGKAVVVTGGTRGIGAQIAAAFHRAGADVLVCGRTPPAPLSAVTATSTSPRPSAAPPSGATSTSPLPSSFAPPSGATSTLPLPAAARPSGATSTYSSGAADGHAVPIGGGGGGAAPRGGPGFFRADVRDPEQAAALINEAVARFGRLDVVVNNAGGSPQVAADSASPRLHAKVIELNLIAPLHVSQAANAVMQAQPGGGVILMIGSVSGTRPSPGTAAYGAAKAGLLNLAASLAVEWAPAVRVNSLVVGPVGNGLTPAVAARTVPAGRTASPDDVAGACLFLASPLAGYVSGAALAVHGGGEWPAYLTEFRPS